MINVEDIEGLAPRGRGLDNQYELFFDKTPFYKVYEDARGINWGRQTQAVQIQPPVIPSPNLPQPDPQPGPPKRSG